MACAAAILQVLAQVSFGSLLSDIEIAKHHWLNDLNKVSCLSCLSVFPSFANFAFGGMLRYQHQRIVTTTKVYIASNNLPVEIIQ